MTSLNHDNVLEIAGPLSDGQIARILECNALEEDLLAALAWLNADDAIGREIHREPSGKVAELCEILAVDQAPDEDDRDEPLNPTR